MKFLLLLSILSGLALAIPAPLLEPRAGGGPLIAGRYIVRIDISKFDDIVKGAQGILKKAFRHLYNFGDFAGFTVDMDDALLNKIRNLPGVEYVEQDSIVNATLGKVEHDLEKRASVTQSGSPWGLSRISRKVLGTSTSYSYDSTAGANTCVYVIDTGIYTVHPEFEGRATFVANFAGDGINDDLNGHGTHVAGTVGSRSYGVSKRTKLFAIKVLDANGSGTSSGVLAGIDLVANDSKTRAGCGNGVVGSMSFGGLKSTALNSATANAVTAGIFMAVAAGNAAQDANDTSPASEPSAYTVGATDKSDNFASFSNFGPIVDILAPGVDILSTWTANGTNILSGTSMATPHISGLAAYILGLEGRTTPAKLAARLTQISTKNAILSLVTGTKNNLAFNNNRIT